MVPLESGEEDDLGQSTAVKAAVKLGDKALFSVMNGSAGSGDFCFVLDVAFVDLFAESLDFDEFSIFPGDFAAFCNFVDC